MMVTAHTPAETRCASAISHPKRTIQRILRSGREGWSPFRLERRLCQTEPDHWLVERLHAERNAHNGQAEQAASHKIAERGKKAAEDPPKNITDKTHIPYNNQVKHCVKAITYGISSCRDVFVTYDIAEPFDNSRVMCGFVGMVSPKGVGSEIHLALQAIQHRGQDSAGAATVEAIESVSRASWSRHRRPSAGRSVSALSNIGLGHVRYPTIGKQVGGYNRSSTAKLAF